MEIAVEVSVCGQAGSWGGAGPAKQILPAPSRTCRRAATRRASCSSSASGYVAAFMQAANTIYDVAGRAGDFPGVAVDLETSRSCSVPSSTPSSSAAGASRPAPGRRGALRRAARQAHDQPLVVRAPHDQAEWPVGARQSRRADQLNAGDGGGRRAREGAAEREHGEYEEQPDAAHEHTGGYGNTSFLGSFVPEEERPASPPDTPARLLHADHSAVGAGRMRKRVAQDVEGVVGLGDLGWRRTMRQHGGCSRPRLKWSIETRGETQKGCPARGTPSHLRARKDSNSQPSDP